MLLDEVLDVPLEAPLRPAALVALAGLLLVVVGNVLEPASAQPVETALLAADHRDERALAAAHERDERRQVELPVDLDLVGDRLGQRQRPPEVVEAGVEEREPVSSVAAELVLEVAVDAAEVVPSACRSSCVKPCGWRRRS